MRKLLWEKKFGDKIETRKARGLGFPGVSDGKESAYNAGDVGLILGLERFPWKREWQPTPAVLPGESHGQRSLTGYSP